MASPAYTRMRSRVASGIKTRETTWETIRASLWSTEYLSLGMLLLYTLLDIIFIRQVKASFGILQINLHDIEASVQEVLWAKEAGLMGGVLLPGTPPGLGLPQLYEKYYEPLWAVCEETGTPVNHHTGSAAPPVTLMISIGVGLDYSLLIVTRYRQFITDGPFTETKEQLMGIYVVDCPSFEDAVEATRRLDFDTGVFEIRPTPWLDPGVLPARKPPPSQ